MDILKCGYVKLHRDMMKASLFTNEKTWKVWTWCIMKAAYKKTEVLIGSKTLKLAPGQFIMGREQASKELNMSIQSIRTALNQLKSSGDIKVEATNKFSVVTVTDWGVRQHDDSDTNQQNNSPCLTSKSTSKSTSKLTSKSTSKKNSETPDMIEVACHDNDVTNQQTNQQINQQINQQTNHKQEVKEVKEVKEEIQCPEIKFHPNLNQVIEYWNKQPCMIKCKEPSEKLNNVFSRLYKIYGLEEILATITRYAVVVEDKKYYFDTRWNMETFLRQRNAFPDFTCDGQKWVNYSDKCISNPDSDMEAVQIWG